MFKLDCSDTDWPVSGGQAYLFYRRVDIRPYGTNSGGTPDPRAEPGQQFRGDLTDVRSYPILPIFRFLRKSEIGGTPLSPFLIYGNWHFISLLAYKMAEAESDSLIN